MAEFREGQLVRYIVEGPIVALVETPDGIGVVLKINGAEAIVLSGRQLDLIQQGPDPRDAELNRLRAHKTACAAEGQEYEQLLVDIEKTLYSVLDEPAENGLVANMQLLAAEVNRLRAKNTEPPIRGEQP